MPRNSRDSDDYDEAERGKLIGKKAKKSSSKEKKDTKKKDKKKKKKKGSAGSAVALAFLMAVAAAYFLWPSSDTTGGTGAGQTGTGATDDNSAEGGGTGRNTNYRFGAWAPVAWNSPSLPALDKP
eukprot:COSAG03_NODE_4412_length_1561_cov_2.298222_2_plen_125_part_00